MDYDLSDDDGKDDRGLEGMDAALSSDDDAPYARATLLRVESRVEQAEAGRALGRGDRGREPRAPRGGAAPAAARGWAAAAAASC